MSALRACFAARGGEGVELAVQACAHDRRHFGLPGTGRLAIGLYAAHLALFLRWYPREQLLALRCEDEAVSYGALQRLDVPNQRLVF